MNVFEIYVGSDGKATTALYERLEQLGPVGVVALNLFRAQKCSERAKEYSRRFKGDAYRRKQWSLENLCQALSPWAVALKGSQLRWGWKEDPTQEYHKWVLYVELPTGQVSFHTDRRAEGPDYPGEWDGRPGLSAQRIVVWVQRLLEGTR